MQVTILKIILKQVAKDALLDELLISGNVDTQTLINEEVRLGKDTYRLTEAVVNKMRARYSPSKIVVRAIGSSYVIGLDPTEVGVYEMNFTLVFTSSDGKVQIRKPKVNLDSPFFVFRSGGKLHSIYDKIIPLIEVGRDAPHPVTLVRTDNKKLYKRVLYTDLREFNLAVRTLHAWQSNFNNPHILLDERFSIELPNGGLPWITTEQ